METTSTNSSQTATSPQAKQPTSSSYHLTPSEIESLRQDLRDSLKIMDEEFSDVEPIIVPTVHS